MQLRNILLIFTLSVLIIFAVLNWSAIMAPTPIYLLFTTVEAPLGLILLTIAALLTVFFLGFVVYMQSSMLMERQRLARDLETQRKLASQAEASRFSELRAYLETELRQLSAGQQDMQKHVESRLLALEQSLNEAIEQTGNSLSAYIGELEDRLENNNHKPTAD